MISFATALIAAILVPAYTISDWYPMSVSILLFTVMLFGTGFIRRFDILLLRTASLSTKKMKQVIFKSFILILNHFITLRFFHIKLFTCDKSIKL